MNGLMDQTRGGAVASGPIEALVPDVPLRSVAAHEGGCYTLAFDRCAARQAPAHCPCTASCAEPCTGLCLHATTLLAHPMSAYSQVHCPADAQR